MAKKYKFFMGGEWREGSSEFEVLSPYDGSLVGVACRGSAAELTEAMDAAHAAFPVLKGWPAYKRAAAMERVVDGLKARKAEIA